MTALENLSTLAYSASLEAQDLRRAYDNEGLSDPIGVLTLSIVIFVCMLDTDWKRKLFRYHGEKNP